VARGAYSAVPCVDQKAALNMISQNQVRNY
jgi:hypothetical protein